MSEFTQRLVECAEREWRYFGGSIRDIDDAWRLAGNELDEPFRSHIGHYWGAVGHPGWNGATAQPWSAAFICWCFRICGAGERFRPSSTHSEYIDWIRLHDGMDEALELRPPAATPPAPGDLIWNSRQRDPAHPDPAIPRNHEDAIRALAAGDYFNSHVDIVVAVGDRRCDSIGGNVWGPWPLDGGSVTRSTWALDDQGMLADGRKDWVGVVRNGL